MPSLFVLPNLTCSAQGTVSIINSANSCSNNVGKENGSIKILESSNLEGVTETIDYVPKMGHAQYKPKQEINY